MSNLKKLEFVKELEKLVQKEQKTISFKRIGKIFVNSLYSSSGDLILDFATPSNEADELSRRYLLKHNYSENQKGYVLN